MYVIGIILSIIGLIGTIIALILNFMIILKKVKIKGKLRPITWGFIIIFLIGILFLVMSSTPEETNNDNTTEETTTTKRTLNEEERIDQYLGYLYDTYTFDFENEKATIVLYLDDEWEGVESWMDTRREELIQEASSSTLRLINIIYFYAESISDADITVMTPDFKQVINVKATHSQWTNRDKDIESWDAGYEALRDNYTATILFN